MKRCVLLIVLLMSTITFVAANPYSFNLYDLPTFNNNTAFVNESANWVTNIGVLSDVNDSQFSNEGGFLTAVKSWWDGLYCELAGCTMEGDINMNGNDLINANNISINNNLSVGNRVDVGGNVVIQDRLFVGINPNETSAVINPGQAVIGRELFIANGSLIGFPQEFGNSIALFAEGADSPNETRFFFGANAELSSDDGQFCDSTNNPFFSNSTGRILTIAFSNEFGLKQLQLEILSVVNSTCVFLNMGIFGNTPISDLTGISYATIPLPRFIVYDQGLIIADIGDAPTTNFKINSLNASGQGQLFLNTIAGSNDVVASIVNTNTNGFLNTLNFVSFMESTAQVDGGVQRNGIFAADIRNYTNGEYVGLSLEVIGENQNMTTTGMQISSVFDSIIEIGKEKDIGKAWYDNTTSVNDITGEINNSLIQNTLFEVDDSIVYIGNAVNFTEISVSVSSGASMPIWGEFYYCNSSGEYEPLNVSDGTNGFVHSGKILFINPTDRGTCNIELDGTPFTNTSQQTYIAIKRTADIVNFPPVVSTISIFEKSSRWLIGNGDDLSEATASLGFINEEFLSEGSVVSHVLGRNSAGEALIISASQVGKNNSLGILGNSQMIMPNYWGKDNFTDLNGKINMSRVTNYLDICATFGPEFNVTCQFASDTLGRGMPLLATGDLEVWLEARVHGGARIDQNLDVVLNTGEEVDIINGGLHVREFRIEEIGLAPGERSNILDVNFDAGVLFPFVQITGGGVVDWTAVSEPECHSGFCARAQGGTVSPLRIMRTNISTLDFNDMNISFFVTTLNIAGADVLNASINNNEGSGEVLLFTTNAILTDEQQNISIPSSMDNRSVVSLSFTFAANNPINEEAFIDEVVINANATADTTANVTRTDSLITFGEGNINPTSGLPFHGIYYNDSSGNIVFLGNVTEANQTVISINSTGNVTVGDTLIVDRIQNMTPAGINISTNINMVEDSKIGYPNTNFSGGGFDITTFPYMSVKSTSAVGRVAIDAAVPVLLFGSTTGTPDQRILAQAIVGNDFIFQFADDDTNFRFNSYTVRMSDGLQSFSTLNQSSILQLTNDNEVKTLFNSKVGYPNTDIGGTGLDPTGRGAWLSTKGDDGFVTGVQIDGERSEILMGASLHPANERLYQKIMFDGTVSEYMVDDSGVNSFLHKTFDTGTGTTKFSTNTKTDILILDDSSGNIEATGFYEGDGLRNSAGTNITLGSGFGPIGFDFQAQSTFGPLFKFDNWLGETLFETTGGRGGVVVRSNSSGGSRNPLTVEDYGQSGLPTLELTSIETGLTFGQDPYIRFKVDDFKPTNYWSMGVDTSDDTFRISDTTTLGTSGDEFILDIWNIPEIGINFGRIKGGAGSTSLATDGAFAIGQQLSSSAAVAFLNRDSTGTFKNIFFSYDDSTDYLLLDKFTQDGSKIDFRVNVDTDFFSNVSVTDGSFNVDTTETKEFGYNTFTVTSDWQGTSNSTGSAKAAQINFRVNPDGSTSGNLLDSAETLRLFFSPNFASSVNITEASVLHSFWNTNVAYNGTIIDAYQIQLDAMDDPINITNAYGISIGDITAGTNSSYSIKTGLGLVDFGDDVKINGDLFTNGSGLRVMNSTGWDVVHAHDFITHTHNATQDNALETFLDADNYEECAYYEEVPDKSRPVYSYWDEEVCYTDSVVASGCANETIEEYEECYMTDVFTKENITIEGEIRKDCHMEEVCSEKNITNSFTGEITTIEECVNEQECVDKRGKDRIKTLETSNYEEVCEIIPEHEERVCHTPVQEEVCDIKKRTKVTYPHMITVKGESGGCTTANLREVAEDLNKNVNLYDNITEFENYVVSEGFGTQTPKDDKTKEEKDLEKKNLKEIYKNGGLRNEEGALVGIPDLAKVPNYIPSYLKVSYMLDGLIDWVYEQMIAREVKEDTCLYESKEYKEFKECMLA